MRWSAVIAGAVLSLGLWILLQTLGTGIGLSAVDTDDVGSLRAVGIGTSVWTIIAPLIALFFGAMLAGRLAGTREPRIGAVHGSVHWALSTILGTWVVLSMIMAMASGVSRIGDMAMRNDGVDVVIPAQGTRADDMRAGDRGEDMRALNPAEERALAAADKTGKGLLMGGLALLLGLGASLAGGALGARRTARRDRGVDDTRGGGPYVPAADAVVASGADPVVAPGVNAPYVDPR